MLQKGGSSCLGIGSTIMARSSSSTSLIPHVASQATSSYGVDEDLIPALDETEIDYYGVQELFKNNDEGLYEVEDVLITDFDERELLETNERILSDMHNNERGPKDSGAVIDHAPEPPTPTQPMSSAASNLKRKASDLSDLTDFRPATRLRIQDPWYLPVVVAHDEPLVELLGELKISEGARWEVARLLSSARLKAVDVDKAKLHHLIGPSAKAAPLVERTLMSAQEGNKIQPELEATHVREHEARSPWADLDREESATTQERLGIANAGSTLWYGGTTQFSMKLVATDGNRQALKYEVLPAEKSTSDRNRRQYGSKAFIRISVKGRMTDEVADFLKRPIVLLGRVYRAFRGKDDHVFFVQTSEIYRDGEVTDLPPGTVPFLQGAQPFCKFIDSYNPLDTNGNQAIAKYAARFDLPLSNSVPAVLVAPEDILETDDIISEAHVGTSKPAAELDLTDGAGYANRALLQEVGNKLLDGRCPTAIQMRIGGCKGLLVLHPSSHENESDTPRVWIRPSQRKVKYAPNTDAPVAHRIVEVLRCSNMKDGCRISTQTIINLAENGVPADVFRKKIKLGIDEMLASMTTFEGKDAMLHLRHTIAENGGIMQARQAREQSGEARARGFISYQRKTNQDLADDEADNNDGEAVSSRSTAWWPDPISGLPSSLEETAVEFIDAGFSLENGILRDKLLKVLSSFLSNLNKPPRFQILLSMSCHGFFIPDPLGILEEGEVFIRCMKTVKMYNGDNVRWSDIIVGDVLITRPPCVLPTDVQKFKAVDRAELGSYRGVIIFSIKGLRSPASLLGGGDYDGDTGTVIWDPEIVKPFRNADISFATEPAGLFEQFHSDVEKVSTFMSRPFSSDSARMSALQDILLGRQQNNNLIGMYSKRHILSMYVYGYQHPDTIRLAYMFCKVLDGGKSGLTVRRNILDIDRAKYDKRGPAWAESDKDRLREEQNCRHVIPQRMVGLPEFIMDVVSRNVNRCVQVAKADAKRIMDRFHSAEDPHLVAPYKDALARAHRLNVKCNPLMLLEIQTIEAHVKNVMMKHRKQIRGDFTLKAIEERQDILRGLSVAFSLSGFLATLQAQPVMPSGDIQINELDAIGHTEAELIMASYAYLVDRDGKKESRFPYDVAFRNLCKIKADACGGRMILYDHYLKFKLDRMYCPPQRQF